MSVKNKETSEKAILKFTKNQIVHSEKYDRFRDFLDGNLDENKMYSMQEVDDLLGKYMKGMVK